MNRHAREAALDVGSARPAWQRIKPRPGDLVVLADIWALVILLWWGKFAYNLDISSAVFALTMFVLLAAPSPERRRLTCSALDDASGIFLRVVIGYVVASAAAALGGEEAYDFRTLLLVAAPVAPGLIAARAFAYRAERAVRRRLRTPTLVVGAGIVARRVVETLEEHEEYGLELVAAVDDDPRFNASELGCQVLAGTSDLPRLVRERGIEVVIVAFSASDQGDMVEVIRAARDVGAQVWVVPRFFELGSSSASSDHLWGLPVVRLKSPVRARRQFAAKRAFDMFVSTIALVALAPVLAAAALAILVTSGRPIFFRQTRIGRNGARFVMYKFRTMRPVPAERSETEWCSDAEDRVTRLGRILRSTSLDELPQLVNVVRGDMSLVGPRPERPHFVKEFTRLYPKYATRHLLPVGLTGWSQAKGLRGDSSIEERVIFDNYYIENWSIGEDLKILVRTVGALVRGEGKEE